MKHRSSPSTPKRRSFQRTRLLAAFLLPAAALIGFSAWVVDDKMNDYRGSADLLLAAQLARGAQSLARDLELERILANRFMSGNGTDWRIELEVQRINTDGRLKALQTMIAARRPSSRLPAPPLPLTPELLDQLRKKVDQGVDPDGSTLAGFTRVITQITSQANLAAPLGPDHTISAYMDLSNAKDRIARARALITRQGVVNPQDLSELDAERRAFEDSFRSHASAHQLAAFEETVVGAAVTKVDALHRSAMRLGRAATGVAVWDEAHAALLELYTRAEERLASEMERTVGDNLHTTRTTFYLVLFGVLGLIGLSLETLRRSERRAILWEEEARKLFRAVEQSPMSVLISNPEGRIEYVNPAFSQMTGYSRDEVVGQNPRLLRSTATPASLFAAMWRSLKDGQDWRGEVINQRKDGTLYWETMTVSPVRDAQGQVENFIAFKEDITEVHSLRQALEREHANQRRVLESTNVPIALIDGNGGFEYANPAMERELGPVGERGAAAYFVPPLPLVSGAARGEWKSELTARTYEVLITQVATASGAPSRLVALYDITTRKQAEEAMAEARQAAELSNRAKTEFLATMSHELRTPLNAIIGFSEIIANELLGPVGSMAYRDYATDINDSGHHLLTLINDILDMARMDVGRLVLVEDLMTPAQVIHAAVVMAGERARAGDVAITEDLPTDLPEILGDERRIKQALVNILANAVKFTPAGGQVSVSAQADDEGLDIVVSDTGIGIAEADLPKVMAPFGQADSSLARSFEGAGLGLPLAARFLELHGGRLGLSARPGGGTIVTLHFPSRRLHRQAQPTRPVGANPHGTDC